ncbi:MAG: 30S ribosomal protein S16 [Clostridiales bacterium]|jgi:small subunit ribosomal protein S16|nr:30S ribosomal protein S16 [Clostridiales bacterium]HOB64473.1 30S ribosomal protein S16 [Clostridia bacterium]HOK81281.1 30S ribosomal protein S16 [Clostridia bacterium]HOL60400.1 30S ribosomal protein S16 [Clostridia bacterium]HPO53157.1 30S ribosomal protein S16 [Clostridia bacterium]
MAVKLRLTRMGAKKSPFYRIVAVDSRKARDGQYIEQIGYYNPVKEPAEIKIDEETARKWLARGAQPTDTVRDLLYNAGIIESSKAYKKKAEAAEAPSEE